MQTTVFGIANNKHCLVQTCILLISLYTFNLKVDLSYDYIKYNVRIIRWRNNNELQRRMM